MKKISIIIPNYNNENYIEQCIYSILNQTMKDFEIIIVDDGSEDNSIKKIKSLMKKNKKIKLIKQFNQNASIARNKGIEIATGEYILFIDADDFLYEKDTLLKMITKIKNNDLLLSNYKIIDEFNNFIDCYNVSNDITKNSNNNIEKYAFVSAVPTNKLFKTNIIHNNNIYFDNVDIGQDLNFYLKYLACSERVVVTKDYSYCYRRNPNGITRKINYNLLDIVKSIECVKKFYKNNEKGNENIIDAVAFINYTTQMNKLENYVNKSDKYFIYRYFEYFIKKLKFDNKYINLNSKLKKAIKSYHIKKFFKIIFLSKYYSNVKTLVLKIRKKF